jgi:hypothetical protein
VDASLDLVRAEVTTWYEKFTERRERATEVGGIAVSHLGEVETSFSRLDELLDVKPPSSAWVPCAPFIYPLILRRFGLSPIAWNEEVNLVVRKYKAARPHEFIRVHQGDAMAHPVGSANLLIYDQKLSERDMDSYRAGSFAMYAVCQLTKVQDKILDKDNRFTNSPTLLKSPIPPLRKVQASPPGRFVLLTCPVVIRRGPNDKDKTYRAAHDFLVRTVPPMSKEQVEKRRAAIREARKKASRWEATVTGSSGESMKLLADHKTEQGARLLIVNEMKQLRIKGEISFIRKVARPSWWGPQFALFGNQEVWKQIFQRFYWDKGLYVMPRLLLGYTPRGGYRERTYGQEDAETQ